jgi:hypothetical protein
LPIRITLLTEPAMSHSPAALLRCPERVCHDRSVENAMLRK